MSVYMVTYDLMRQGQNYAGIVKKLEAYPVHWHCQGSVWIIESAQTAAEVRDSLATCLDENDKLIVARLEGEAAWSGYTSNISEWLKARLERRAAA